MSNSEWEAIYAKGEQLNIWPFTDLVSLFMRHQSSLIKNRINSGPLRVLELGFGAGNNIEFFLSQGFDYYGIEYSESAFKFACHKYPNLERHLILGSFSDIEQYECGFDAVIDRGSVTCSTNLEVEQTIGAVRNILKSSGLFFGVDWFSKNHSDFSLPSTFVDSCTRTDFAEGQFKNQGNTHFVNQEEILNTFIDFRVLSLTEKIVRTDALNMNSHQFASWNIVAEKQS